MSSTEARTTGGETTDTTETREVASSAAERLGGPLDDERTRDTASEAETDVGRRAETTVGEGERSSETASRARPRLVVEPTPATASGAPTQRTRPRPTPIVKPTPA